MDKKTLKHRILTNTAEISFSPVSFETLLEEYDSYSGRFIKNYDRETLITQKSQGRFDIGGAHIHHDGIHTRSFLMENVDGWLSITRMISYQFPMLPVLTVCQPLLEYAKKTNHIGIMASVNAENRVYLNCFDHDSKSNSRLSCYPIYAIHRQTVDKMTLRENIMYNGVLQHLMYYPIKND